MAYYLIEDWLLKSLWAKLLIRWANSSQFTSEFVDSAFAVYENCEWELLVDNCEVDRLRSMSRQTRHEFNLQTLQANWILFIFFRSDHCSTHFRTRFYHVVRMGTESQKYYDLTSSTLQPLQKLHSCCNKWDTYIVCIFELLSLISFEHDP